MWHNGGIHSALVLDFGYANNDAETYRTMSGIFINYRRDDSSGHADRIYDHLVAHFGRDRVFMDIDTIVPGDDFIEVIERTCLSCRVFLVLIGKTWVDIKDKRGRRRLDNPNDLVRMEIARGLAHGVRVVPVLLDDADMPEPDTLPDELKKLAFRHAIQISRGQRFQHDIRMLIDAVEKALAQAPAPVMPKEVTPRPPSPEERGRLEEERQRAEQAKEEQERQAAKQDRLEEERKQAAERAQLEEERKQAAAQEAAARKKALADRLASNDFTRDLTFVLSRYKKHGSDLYIYPEIPKDKLANVVAISSTSPESIIGVIDCTLFGNARHYVMFTKNSVQMKDQFREVSIPYQDFEGLAKLCRKGYGLFGALSGSNFTQRLFTQLINDIKELVSSQASPTDT